MPFWEDLAFGKSGEHIAWLDLLESPKTKQVLDVRFDPYFKEKDIDFLQLDFENNVNKIEVKADRRAHETGNIAFETKSKTTEGCLARSEADYIYYYIEKTNEVLILRVDALKGYIKYKDPKEIPMGDNARGYLLNIQDLIDYKVAVRR